VGGPSGAAKVVDPPSDESLKYAFDPLTQRKQDSKVCKSLWVHAVLASEYHQLLYIYCSM